MPHFLATAPSSQSSVIVDLTLPDQPVSRSATPVANGTLPAAVLPQLPTQELPVRQL